MVHPMIGPCLITYSPVQLCTAMLFGSSTASDVQVVRGGPAFAVSLVLSAIEPGFRSAAELGAWQLISPVNATGKVVVVSGLHEVQEEVRSCSACALGTICSLCTRTEVLALQY